MKSFFASLLKNGEVEFIYAEDKINAQKATTGEVLQSYTTKYFMTNEKSIRKYYKNAYKTDLKDRIGSWADGDERDK